MKNQAGRVFRFSIVVGLARARRKVGLAISLAMCMLVCGLSAMAHEAKIISFDPAGSQGTYPGCLSQTGVIVGTYYDASNVGHGFLRTPDGKITAFNVKGAGSGSGQGTFPYGNNAEGQITGTYADAVGVYHGFLRDRDGDITTLNVKGAGSGGTIGGDINPKGEIAGYYVDANSVAHGFLRTPSGKIVVFDAPGVGTAPGQGTYPSFCDALTPEGAITGVYLDANNVNHGFVRAPDGGITTFDVPGAGTEPGPAFCIFCPGTFPTGINAAGVITGLYLDAANVQHSFVRYPHGAIVTFDAPGAGSAVAFQGTTAENINSAGEITGYLTDANFFDHGFVREPNGRITDFDAPGAGSPPGGQFYGTVPACNNDAGEIAGYYTDANGLAHGFLRKAECDGKDCN
jgi:hypothetical protein